MRPVFQFVQVAFNIDGLESRGLLVDHCDVFSAV